MNPNNAANPGMSAQQWALDGARGADMNRPSSGIGQAAASGLSSHGVASRLRGLATEYAEGTEKHVLLVTAAEVIVALESKIANGHFVMARADETIAGLNAKIKLVRLVLDAVHVGP